MFFASGFLCRLRTELAIYLFYWRRLNLLRIVHTTATVTVGSFVSTASIPSVSDWVLSSPNANNANDRPPPCTGRRHHNSETPSMRAGAGTNIFFCRQYSEDPGRGFTDGK